jgi:hypothetical protein
VANGDASTPPAQLTPKEMGNGRLPVFHRPQQPPREPQDTDWFQDVTGASGVEFVYRDGQETGFYELIENLGGGVAMCDYDRDGRLDLYLTGGGQLNGPPIEIHGLPSALYRNGGDLRFVDVTPQAGVSAGTFYSHGVTVADFDNDGFPDLFVAGFQGCRLYRNNGDGSFSDATDSAGLVIDRWAVSGAWLDIDNDACLDLYVITYCDWLPDHTRRCPNDQGLRDTCAPFLYPGARDYLWRSRGDGTFEDITDRAGLEPASRALGLVSVDVNEDGWMDIYVVNDVQENHLYQGGPKLPLQSIGLIAGVSLSTSGERQGSMGVDAGDFDGDGLIDLWYANYSNQDNSLMRNMGDAGFLGSSETTKMLGVSRPWVGFGTGFVDFDGDGWLDLFVMNGHVSYDRLDAPYYQPPQLFRNHDGRHYTEISDLGGPYFSIRHAGRGAAVGDLDNDGGPDLAVSHQNDPVTLLRNRQPAEHWVRVALHGVRSNRDAVGAKVTAPFGDRQLTRWVRGGGGYASYFDPRILFPAKDDKSITVTVKWPGGGSEVFADLQPGRTHELIEGLGRRP